MVKTKTAPKKISKYNDQDGPFILKVVLYLVLGSQWLWLDSANGSRVPIPIGLIIGIVFAMHDHFRIDRKIEYAVLLVAMLVGFVANIGIAVSS